MNILHYALGFPPYRTGGMTKFTMDLMKEQSGEGNQVSLLWPGRMKLSGKTKIRFSGKVQGISGYEVMNPNPVPYDEGIRDIRAFMRKGNKSVYEDFLRKLHPDVIHIHTFMGLQESLLDAAKEGNIRLVFTAHDFFPICPKVTMFRNNQVCDSIETCEACGDCNGTALSLWKIGLLQSAGYRKWKESYFVRKLRKGHRDAYLKNCVSGNAIVCADESRKKEYKMLRKYYGRMLEYMDTVHFNSNLTRKIYEKYMHIGNSAVIAITHSDIRDNRKRKDFGHNLRITYLGPQGGAKGFFLLKAALDLLWQERRDFCLNVFFEPAESMPYVKTHERYRYDQLGEIFEDTDILAVPSIWFETFGYTVLEAVSFGVPAVISANVGACDILPEGGGIIVREHTPEAWKEAFDSMTVQKLEEMNGNILRNADILTISEMNRRIQKECYAM